ncbi:GTP-binding protein [Cytophagaceae bacterium ABcell3]|nr:GTP-binding protein [Cytophagaceae bacterium ABcell3]
MLKENALIAYLINLNMQERPVTILTGFLGAGKTTFLNALIEVRKNQRFAIIENEFGEAGIDSELILRAEGDIVEMNNGCLCCTLNENLYEILNQLFHKEETFDELIIEATGIADPAGIALPFLNQPAIGKAFPLTRVICLVDAELIEDQLKENESCIQQISFSDIILINKTDRVNPRYVQELVKVLAKINPCAKVFAGNKDKFPLEAILSVEPHKSIGSSYTPNHGHGKKNNHQYTHHHHHHNHGDITSITFKFKEQFDFDRLYARLFAFLIFQAKDVYRIKGIIKCGDGEGMIIQSVGKNISTKKHPSSKECLESRIVFIGKGLEEKAYENMLRSCIA